MDSIQEYHAALNRLEANLLTPLVPGEVKSWIAIVTESAQQVDTLLRGPVLAAQRKDYSQIGDQDKELLHRVEQMKKGDGECLVQFEALLARIEKIVRGADLQSEPNETAFKVALSTVAEHGLAAVIQVKRQEKARETWLSESFNRERGTGD